MKYLIFETQEAAEARNHEEAVRRGCSGVTQYWWNMEPVEGGFGLAVGDDPLHDGEATVDLQTND